MRDRSITTLEGLDSETLAGWSGALLDSGGAQCGFCTPGIIMRVVGLESKLDRTPLQSEVEQTLLAHLCRCTGWQTIVEAAVSIGNPRVADRDLNAASRRAAIEGNAYQQVSLESVLGVSGFSADTAPAGSLIAVSTGDGGWAVGERLDDAHRAAGKVQGRRTTVPPSWPLEVPEGDWVRTLRTTWVEPAFLETDAAWCEPGGEPSSPLANGGAFGAKIDSPVRAAAQRLANEHGRPVLALASREDSTRWGPKRPPVAAGIRADGTGVMRVVSTEGITDAVAAIAPSMEVDEIDVVGPATSSQIRGAGWIEAAVLTASLEGDPGWITGPSGGSAKASFDGDDLKISVRCGDPLDPIVLRSYCIGAAHLAWSWVMSESLAVVDGEINDLTIRSFNVAKATEMPHVDVTIEPETGEPINGSDAVVAAVAAAVWIRSGCGQDWPVNANMSL